MRAVRRVLVAAAFAGSLAVCCATAEAAGGSPIANAATATYEVAPGRLFTVVSNTLQTIVASVGAIAVSPKEESAGSGESFGSGLPVDRTFTITNGGNVPDAYVIASVTSGSATLASASFVAADGTAAPAVVGTTVSAAVAPGASIDVTVHLLTAAVAPGTTFAIVLTARSTAAGTVNGVRTDAGRRWAAAVAPPSFTGPLGARTAVIKTVDEASGRQAQPGAAITYQIRFRNDGAAAATNAVVVDTVPAGIRPVAASVQLDGVPASATLAGNTLRISVGTIAPGTTHVLTIAATVDAAAPAGVSYVNVASIGADGIAFASTTPAGVFVGTSNVVFDALLGRGHPIAGAIVTLVDSATLQPLALRRALGAAAGTVPAGTVPAGSNPFVTGADGTYAFPAISPAPGGSVAFTILVRAAHYRDRAIAATLVADAGGTLSTVTLTALDGQPLATAGGFTLTPTTVRLDNVDGLLGNIPLLPAAALIVAKSADRAVAEAGDRVLYTVTFSSASTTPLGTTSVIDTPAGELAYALGSAKLDGVALEPLVAGRSLRWRLDALQPGQAHTLTYAAVVLPGVADGASEVNSVTVSAAFAQTAIVASAASSTATIAVRAGVFSDRGVITGRVFTSRGGETFRAGDHGIPGVRIYLESGTSVVTDANGRFSFHGVRAGAHVLRLDASSLPHGVRLADDRSIAGTRSPIRLVHGIFDDGLLQDVNFALVAS
jgi:uncharacterized repeat protein (TIGR01451 family)